MLDTSQLEGATIAHGTVARFETANGAVSYASTGQISNVNLQRVGRAFHIAALDTPEYNNRLNSTYNVQGSGRTFDQTKLDATGTLTDSEAWGARFPRLGYETHLNAGTLDARAKGRFEQLDPSRVTGSAMLKGLLTGTTDVHTRIADVGSPITLDAFAVDGTVSLEHSTLGDLQVESAEVDGKYASRVGDLSKLTLTGPDVKVEASGRVALDTSSASNLTYHIEATRLEALARLAGQESVEGSTVLDGTLTGNAASLQTTGKMNGSGLGWKDISALDANSQYTVTVPDLDVAKARVQSTASATFVKVGALELNEVTATTTYQNTQLDFDATAKQQDREVVARGDVIFHPDHQEVHLPSLAVRTQGIEWRTAPGSAAAYATATIASRCRT